MKGKKFRQYLNKVIVENKLNQTTLSDKLKCNHSYVSLLLNEKRQPTIAFITKVCKTFKDEKKISEFLMELT